MNQILSILGVAVVEVALMAQVSSCGKTPMTFKLLDLTIRIWTPILAVLKLLVQ